MKLFFLLVVECGPLTAPSNGNVRLFGKTHNSVATYSCNGGYYLTGNSYRVCWDNGDWSGSVPSCEGKP